MTENLLEQWTDALESGEYKQTKNVLHNNQGYCCLGVLCDLYAKEYDLKWTAFTDPGNYTDKIAYKLNIMGDSYKFPPDSIIMWFWKNITNQQEISYNFATVESIFSELAVLNDHGATFSEIAETIKKFF